MPLLPHAPPHTTRRDGQFPYCRCIDYGDISSPYSVVLDSTTSPNFTVTVVERPEPDTPTDCYDRIKENGVPKIELMSSECDHVCV